MSYLGFEKNSPYLNFERSITGGLDILWEDRYCSLNERDRNALRLHILKMRCLARDLWIRLGNEVPKDIRFIVDSPVL